MRTVCLGVYKYAELDERAKERARDWYRQGGLDYDWWDCVYEDASNIAKLMGIDLNTRRVTLMNGGARYEPNIWFSGFWSQGDGACFEGTYAYRKHSVSLVRNFAPKDERLISIADRLAEAQRRNFYKITATVKHRGHYYHEMCTDIEVDGWRSDSDCEQVKDALRDFMRWIYRQLEREYEYLTSDEAVAESIEANEYEFYETGERA